MSYEHKANTGTLFPNNKKADNHPDYKGKIKVGEVEFELAGWIKKTDKGQFLSLKLSEPFQPNHKAPRRRLWTQQVYHFESSRTHPTQRLSSGGR